MLITEWLSTDAQIEWLGRVFCFPTRPLATRRHKKFGQIAWPNLRQKAAPGGHTKHRPAAWRADAGALRTLRAWNALDLELFRWAQGNARATMDALNRSSSSCGAAGAPPPPPLPPLPPVL